MVHSSPLQFAVSQRLLERCEQRRRSVSPKPSPAVSYSITQRSPLLSLRSARLCLSLPGGPQLFSLWRIHGYFIIIFLIIRAVGLVCAGDLWWWMYTLCLPFLQQICQCVCVHSSLSFEPVWIFPSVEGS